MTVLIGGDKEKKTRTTSPPIKTGISLEGRGKGCGSFDPNPNTKSVSIDGRVFLSVFLLGHQ